MRTDVSSHRLFRLLLSGDVGRFIYESSLASVTLFVAAGGPRFCFSVRPEPPAPNYAQLLLQLSRSEDTNRLVGPLQEALASRIAGARIDVRTVETGPPTIIPVSMRIFGDDPRVLHREAEQLEAILKTSPFALNVRDDWGTTRFELGSTSIRTVPALPVCRAVISR
jgi:multidrug efflux pump